MENKARDIALRLIFNNLGRFDRIKLDMRFSFNKEVGKFLELLKISEDEKTRINRLRSDRRKSRRLPFQNVLSNPIVRDYLSNKHHLLDVRPDHLYFIGHRNHWAKNNFDRKILSVLINNQNK